MNSMLKNFTIFEKLDYVEENDNTLKMKKNQAHVV